MTEIALMTVPQMLSTLQRIGAIEEAEAQERSLAAAHARLGGM